MSLGVTLTSFWHHFDFLFYVGRGLPARPSHAAVRRSGSTSGTGTPGSGTPVCGPAATRWGRDSCNGRTSVSAASRPCPRCSRCSPTCSCPCREAWQRPTPREIKVNYFSFSIYSAVRIAPHGSRLWNRKEKRVQQLSGLFTRARLRSGTSEGNSCSEELRVAIFNPFEMYVYKVWTGIERQMSKLNVNYKNVYFLLLYR